MLDDLLPKQRELAECMSALSQSAYSAGWMQDLEYALWRAVSEGLCDFGRLHLTLAHISKLRDLSVGCGGWIRFDQEDDEVFVPMERWMQLYEQGLQLNKVGIGDWLMCDRCCRPMTCFTPTLPTIMKMQRMERQHHVAALVELEGATSEEASEWVHHKYYRECMARTAHCQKCGLQLRTWKAKQCLHCGHDWHEPAG